MSIGGYFELEINDFGTLYHDEAVALNTGRNSFEFILKSINYKHIYVPLYTCDVILEPIKKTNIPYSFYKIDSNFLPLVSKIEDEGVLLYTNYYGIMNDNVKQVVKKYKNVIIDNAQAFYDKPFENVPTFYSPRKFFGLPDGGFAYCLNEMRSIDYSTDESSGRFTHLLKSSETNKENNYDDFQKNEDLLKNRDIMKMSKLTLKLLRGIDFEKVRKKRIANFNYLHNYLKNDNLLTPFIENSSMQCPMIYPFMAEKNNLLRQKLIDNKIYTAIYWSNVFDWTEKESFEYKISEKIIHLPIDQRYNSSDLEKIVSFIKGV
jgi:hypothetical protein